MLLLARHWLGIELERWWWRDDGRRRLDELVDLKDDALAVEVDGEYVGQALHAELGELESADDDLGVVAGEHARDVARYGQMAEEGGEQVASFFLF